MAQSHCMCALYREALDAIMDAISIEDPVTKKPLFQNRAWRHWDRARQRKLRRDLRELSTVSLSVDGVTTAKADEQLSQLLKQLGGNHAAPCDATTTTSTTNNQGQNYKYINNYNSSNNLNNNKSSIDVISHDMVTMNGSLCDAETDDEDIDEDDEELAERDANQLEAFYDDRLVPLGGGQALMTMKELRVEESACRILHHMPTIVSVTDESGRLRYVNKQCTDYLGLTLADFRRMARRNVDFGAKAIHPEDRGLVKSIWSQAFKTGEAMEMEFRYKSARDGQYRWFLTRAVPVRDQKGHITQWIGSATDIHYAKTIEADLRQTEKQLDADQRLLKTVLAQLPVGMKAAHAPSGEIFLRNDKMSEMWGVPSRDRTMWRKVSEYVNWPGYHPDGSRYKAMDWPLARTIVHGEVVVDEDINVDLAGNRRGVLRINSAPVRGSDGTIIAGVMTAENVTERLKADAERTRLMASEQAALESVRLKSEFLANMSHEIRTPLNGVIGMVDLLMETKLTREQIDFADTIKKSGTLLLTVINDILDFSKVEAGKLKLEHSAFLLRDAIKVIDCLMQPQAGKKGIELKFQVESTVPDMVIGDPGRLKQILFNLVGNSIKFTGFGRVDVHVTSKGISDNQLMLEIAVSDTGIGMSKETLSHLFQPFTQADSSTTRMYGGTGLGLSICKGLVELMNGRITVTSTEGMGSTFDVTIQLTERTPSPDCGNGNGLALNGSNGAHSSNDSPPAYGDVKVLVAEDNPINQAVITRVLRKLGVEEVCLAENGQKAFHFFMQRPENFFDFALMDCQMPVMDGYEATRLIRKFETEHNYPRRLPIIALTASAMKSDVDACLAAGMDDHVAKPFSHAIIASVLLRYSRAQQATAATNLDHPP